MPQAVTSRSPQSPSDVVGEFPAADASDVRAAVDRAGAARLEWASIGAAGRSAALSAAARALRERSEEATALIVREVGKPLTEARGELARAVAILDYYAQACVAASGELYPPSVGALLYSERRPCGVAGLITPWNFPLAIPLWKAAPALAAGNAVVLKPSPEAAACAELLSSVLGGCLPAGVFSVVQGEAQAGTTLVACADVVSFTGSAAVGAAVTSAAAGRGIPVQCEMGGQNAAIVLPDADAAATAAMIASAAMGYAGQKCTATRRVIVVGGNEGFIDALADAVSALAPAPPEDGGTVLGPVISRAAQQRVSDAVAAGEAAGGRVLAGGGEIDREGWFAPATLLDGLDPGHELAREETFGPLAIVLRAADLEQAMHLSGGVRFGLVTSLHGRDLDALLAGVAMADTGLVKVNAPTTGVDFYAPFGGEKDSSYGLREQGPRALDFYSSTRTVTIAPHGA